MTQYSRAGAEQLITDANKIIEDVLSYACQLDCLRREGDEQGSQAALLHARLDQSLAWFTDRCVRLDGLEPLALSFPCRLIVDDEPFDVWLSWQHGEATIGWFYGLTEAFALRRRLPPNALV
ncbi:MAG: DUF2203 family protein [Nitriliruptoraceae bacterium]